MINARIFSIVNTYKNPLLSARSNDCMLLKNLYLFCCRFKDYDMSIATNDQEEVYFCVKDIHIRRRKKT